MTIQDQFHTHFQTQPDFLVRSPGRVNLIGEHVDYNNGFVLPMAVPLQTDMAIRARDDNKVRLISPIFGDEREFDLHDLQKTGAWIDYAQAHGAIVHKGIAQVRSHSDRMARLLDAPPCAAPKVVGSGAEYLNRAIDSFQGR